MNLTSRSDLLLLPTRSWNDTSSYDSILLLSNGEEHDSGWGMMTIIGVRENKPIEIVSQCTDDIGWHLPLSEYEGKAQMNTDCCIESGALHFWYPGVSGSKAKFTVGCAISSIDIKVTLNRVIARM
jgi:hypothetical protein